MQEKTCPICGENYYKFIDYCFRDGAKLVFPGEEAEVEDTELLSQVHKIQYNEAVKPNRVDEDETNTLGLNIAKPNVEESAEVIDEDLEDPMALGNTQMLRKEDLLAMFHDDSTYNGELVDPDEDTATFDTAETEEMEATETFDLTNRNNEEKTEFEQSTVPLPIRDDITPVVQQVNKEERVESIPLSTPAPPPKPSPIQHEHHESEKEPSVSPLLLMGGLLGLVFVIVGFFFFYQNSKNQVVVPPPQKKEPVQQMEPESPKKQEPVEAPPEVEEAEEPNEEVQPAEEVKEADAGNELVEEDLTNMLQLRVKVEQTFVPISVPESIEEQQLIEKLKEIGVVFEEGTTTKISFLNADFTEQVVTFPLPKDSPFYPVIDFNFGKEE